MQDKLIIIAIVLSIGFSAGWTVNGWRHSKVKADLAICQGNTKQLMLAMQSQNRAIRDLKEESEQRKQASESALKAAQVEINKLRQSSASIANRTGEGCGDAEKLLDEVLGL